MLFYSHLLLASASLASASVIRRADPPLQSIPATAQADNTFNNGAAKQMMPDDTSDPVPDVYGARSIDLPFGRLYHGTMKFFSAGQLNTPDANTDEWPGEHPGVVDSAKQSACGIPDNAFLTSKVAIHPYFLKYADLSRYCMQDVCISFWNGKQAGQGQSDMMLKVTDVCSTDPSDPTHCEKPGDIKIDRTKCHLMEGASAGPTDGNQYNDGETWWFFTKCWADGLVQPAYKDNWFAQPALPNNLKWSQGTVTQQMLNNNISYPQHQPAWSKYPNGAYNPQYDSYISPPIADWSPGQPDPSWCPVAGGKGWGNPTGNCAGNSGSGSSGTSQTSRVTNNTSTLDQSSPAGNSSSGVSQASLPSASTPQDESNDSTTNNTSAPVQSSPVENTPSSSTSGTVVPASFGNGTTSQIGGGQGQAAPSGDANDKQEQVNGGVGAGSLESTAFTGQSSSGQEQAAPSENVNDKQEQSVGGEGAGSLGSSGSAGQDEDDECEP